MTIRRSLGAFALLVAAAASSGCDDITGSDDATIIVQNNASVSASQIFIADCEDETWGADRLGSETIAPGADREFGVEPGCYDLRATFSDLTFAEDFGIDIDEGEEFTWELVD